jgi:hypothetical protein
MTSRVSHSKDLEIYGVDALVALAVVAFIWVVLYYR